MLQERRLITENKCWNDQNIGNKYVIFLFNGIFSGLAKVAVQDEELEVKNTVDDDGIIDKDMILKLYFDNPNSEIKCDGDCANKTLELNTTINDIENEIIQDDNLDQNTENVTDNLVNNEDLVNLKNVTKVDNGTALLLTPFVESGRFEEARNASKVTSDIFFGIECYTGFLTVNKTYNSNLFFWYFPVDGKPVHKTPWLIWLQGGPGASSLTGLFDEIGPFTVDKNGVLKENPYTWRRNHSLLFIDNPVGTGYSFTENWLGLAGNMETYSKHLYSAVEQFLQIFPELRLAPLYVAGESYAGKYAPCLAMELHKHKTSTALDINLQGVIVGNGYIDPSMISNIPRSFYNLGIIQKEQMDLLQPLRDSINLDIAANRSVEAKEKWGNLIIILLSMSHQKHAYNFLKDDLQLGNYGKYFLIRSDVKKAIHVGDINFSFINITVNSALASDFLSSTQNLFETLLENYRILLYCGQLDQILPCVTISENHRSWRWSRSNDFNTAIRYPILYDNKLAGYHKSGGGFTEAIVRGAGHMAPLDSPGSTQSLVTNWTHNIPLYTDPMLQILLRYYLKGSSTIYL